MADIMFTWALTPEGGEPETDQVFDEDQAYERKRDERELHDTTAA